MAEVTTEPPELRHGSEWADHEDCIVGNKEGLRRLRNACDVALREGEYYGSDLGEFVGVKMLESSWFSHPHDSINTRTGNLVAAMVIIALLAIFAVGVVTVVAWFTGRISYFF